MQTGNPLMFGGHLLLGLRIPDFLKRPVRILIGALMLGGLVMAVAALATWNVSDPSFSYANGEVPANVLGHGGAAFTDIMMQFFGLASVAVLLPMILWGLYLLRGRPVDRVVSRLSAWFGGSILSAAVLACVPTPDTWPLPTGLGGVFGDMILKMPSALTGDYPSGFLAVVLAIVLAMPATWLMLFGAALIAPPEVDKSNSGKVARARMQRVDDDEEEDEDGGRAFAAVFLGAATHFWLIGRAHLRRLAGRVAEKLARQAGNSI